MGVLKFYVQSPNLTHPTPAPNTHTFSNLQKQRMAAGTAVKLCNLFTCVILSARAQHVSLRVAANEN